ncbi:MAG: polysaccharide deacetylase family protein [Elusimicrobiales bacterium]
MILKFLIIFIFIMICSANDKRYIYLTIDDGPSALTSDICDLLKKHKAKASFFVLGKNVKRYPKMLERIFADGHLVGNHTYSHINFYKKRDDIFLIRQEIKKAEDEIFRIIGVKPLYLRYPYGYHSQKAIEIASDMGYKVINWDFGYDWKNDDEDVIISRYRKNILAGKIILMHDTAKRNKMALRLLKALLEEGEKKGLVFVRLDEVR